MNTRYLQDRRDGLLREAEYLEKRLKVIHDEVIALNLRIAPSWPVDRDNDQQ